MAKAPTCLICGKEHWSTQPCPAMKAVPVTVRDITPAPKPVTSHTVTPDLLGRLIKVCSEPDLEALAAGRMRLVKVGGSSSAERKRRSRQRQGTKADA